MNVYLLNNLNYRVEMNVWLKINDLRNIGVIYLDISLKKTDLKALYFKD